MKMTFMYHTHCATRNTLLSLVEYGDQIATVDVDDSTVVEWHFRNYFSTNNFKIIFSC